MKSRIWTIMNGVTLTAFLVGRSSGQQPPDPPAPALVRQPSSSSLIVTYWIPFNWIKNILTDVLALAGQWRGSQQALILN